MIRIPLARLAEQASKHPPGYISAIAKAGRREGLFLVISEAKWRRIRGRFGLATPVAKKLPGWGDRVHAIALPFARFVDGFFGTHLRTCQACARRRHWLNRLGAWVGGKWDAGRGVIRRLIGR